VMNGVLILHQVVVGGQDGPAGQAEYNVYALFEKAFPNYLTASFQVTHTSCSSLIEQGFVSDLTGF
jgi:hypothetical protein